MKGLFKLITKRKERNITYNLPDVIKKENSQIKFYQKENESDIFKEKDLLFYRFEKPIEIDYIKELELSGFAYIRMAVKNKLKNILRTIGILPKTEKNLKRTNIHLRTPYFSSELSDNKKFLTTQLFVMCVLFFYCIGYGWARFRYDTYWRKYMYTHFTSTIIAFEVLDNYISELLNKFDKVLPKEISDQEMSYIVHKKIYEYANKRKYSKQIDFVLKTDPDLLEIDNLIKRIRK